MVMTGIGVRAQRLFVAALALAVVALAAQTPLRAQLPVPSESLFEMTGFIQKATLDDPSDKFSGGTLTLNNHVIVIPKYTIFQMPATALTWAELFSQAPAPWGPTQTGLALGDTPKPGYTFEVTVQGNRVGDGTAGQYIAGLVFISSLSVQQHQGFIDSIDYATGEFVVGKSRVRLNDPIGRFGRAWTHDKRFTIDEDNPTVKSETGYPMCIPRVAPTSTSDDPLCPQTNRPEGRSIFTMGTPAAPTAAERQNPALRTAALDPWRAAPLQVGDYVTVRGPMVKEADGAFISAFAVDANVGIFTAPGTKPVYVSIDVALMGTGPVNDPVLAQEGARRVRLEGFTTDFNTPVMVGALDVNACTGEGVDRLWQIQGIDPGAPAGAVAGRWRFIPTLPLFDLKGFPFLPPTREVHAVSLSGTVTTLNGLSAGEYTSPTQEFILPENRGIGTPWVPGNFELMEFLAQGSGLRGDQFTGQLAPWPGLTPPVRKGCAVVGADITTTSGSSVTLDGSRNVAANAPVGGATYKWSQLSGTSVATNNATSAVAGFTAPTVAMGASPLALTYKLTATPANGAPAVDSRTVTVTVTPPPDTVKPTVGTPTLVQGTSTNPTTLKVNTPVTLNVSATDNVGVTSVTFFYTYTLNNVKQTGIAIATKSATGSTWTGSFTPTVKTSYSVYAVAADAANNQTTGAARNTQ